ncbi:hypothetical protein BpJC7_26370 [Weizmannia acidilactici]|uniref:DUF1129 domain-containing protein n=1 Tax=Weizmannia acidilactici TaxID=2607726 RepID=A0A5J4JQI4_9BACI|nr:DUF1129 family protein [Weizmannia acidilactici]GER68288.1 hypothetical protein BpJC4_27590 [Weizmannia acidilactici]GER71334.1 hypothetical protein BpJC7_26370 [Weizmannia acidilactici]GER72558.1 hypothetical protein BpPP18_06250 [Weizmannia acidilactici]
MVSAKQLIEENNRKREELTPENEKYYGDLLIYIRLQLTLSEQQSEEVLMELLDHLLEGQKENKTAEEMFGGDPKAFADEIIRQLPKEEKRNMIPFITRIVIMLAGIQLVINGIGLPLWIHFQKPIPDFYPVTAAINFCISLLYIAFAMWYVLLSLKKTLFSGDTKRNNIIFYLKIYLGVCLFLAISILTDKFMPKIGPSFSYPWWLPLISGVLCLGIYYLWGKAAKT